MVFILQNNKTLTVVYSNRLLSEDQMLSTFQENIHSTGADVPGRRNTKSFRLIRFGMKMS